MSRMVFAEGEDKEFLAIRMFRRCLYLAVESERDWIVASVEKKDFNLFKRLGFKKTSIISEIVTDSNNKTEANIFIFNTKNMKANDYINIFRRSYITKSSNDLAVMKGLIKPTIMSRMILRYCSKIYKIYIALSRFYGQ